MIAESLIEQGRLDEAKSRLEKIRSSADFQNGIRVEMASLETRTQVFQRFLELRTQGAVALCEMAGQNDALATLKNVVARMQDLDREFPLGKYAWIVDRYKAIANKEN